MGQVLEALHRLQEVELELAVLRRDRSVKVRRVESQNRQVQKIDEKIQQSKLTVRQRQIRLDSLQLEMSSREESVAKHRQALNKAKTNKEYAAILAAMNTEKADNAKYETEILQLMEDVQTMTAEIELVEAERAQLLEGVAKAEENLRRFDEANKSQADLLQSRRDECAEHLDPSTLNAFTRVAEHHDGEAMVPVSKLHPKRDEFMCSGCNIKMTLEIVNALQTRDEIQMCQSCGRILYLEPQAARP